MTISANFPNVKPSLLLDFANAQQLPPAVTFTRATTAAYYNGSTTAMAEQNLQTYSQVFDTGGWTTTNNGLTTVNTTTAPDGTLTGNTFSATATSVTTGTPTQVYRYISGNPVTSNTASIYAKANTSNFLYIREYFSDSGENVTWFNLSTGAVGTTSANHTASIVSVGNSWYRCIITVKPDAIRSQSLGFGVSTSNGSFDVTTSSSIYIWGAQFEERTSVTAYTATTTQAITNYVPVLLTAGGGQPRFDHNPTTSESLGLLIEEQRTNLLLYSNTLSNWGSIGAQAPGTTIVPSGELSGVNANRTGPNNLYTVVSVSNATTYTFSVYAKAGFGSQVNFGVESGFGTYAVVGFNLSSGIAPSPPSGTTVSMTSVGNGWYRLTMTGTTTSTSVTLHIAATTADYTNGVWVWGAQLELGSFATSYIPTTSAAATRAADFAQMTGTNFSSWFNSSEGTIYSDATQTATNAQSKGIYTFFNTDLTNSINFYLYGTTYFADVYSGGSVAPLTGTYSSSKTSLGYKLNNVNLANGNVLGTADTSCNVAISPNTLYIGNTYAGSSYPYTGWIKKLAYYPIRVTDAQLQALNT